jgi:two-component system, OmpR family, alkaline phosphatase synthesis response regulator PhoP
MSKKVLIAEDQPDSRRLLQDILEYLSIYGVETLIATDGKEALDAIRTHKPDLVLLDVMMPNMSGFEVCEQVKKDPALAKTYIIIVSAKIQPDDRRQAATIGADEYLTKPYDVNAVIQRVQHALGITRID